MKVRFETDQYVAAHGHAPRGRGFWMFFVDGLESGGGLVQCIGTYAEAKKQVATALRCLGFQPSGGIAVVKVCS